MASDAASAVTGLLSGVIKFALTIGGLLTGLVGLLLGNMAIVGLGAAMFILGRVVHSMDQRALDRQTQRWASEALGGMAPVPPRDVRMRLMRSSAQLEGVGGDIKRRYQMECRAWAAGHFATSGERAKDVTR